MNESAPSAQTPNRIEDRAPKPAGVIPKHLQSIVIMGVAVGMILVMWLTGGKKATLKSPVAPPLPPLTATDPSKVQEFKRDIQGEQQSQRRAVPVPGVAQPGTFDIPGIPETTLSQAAGQQPQQGALSPTGIPGYRAGESSAGSSESPQDELKTDRKKRQYLSLFASNIALTYRQGQDAGKLTGGGQPTSSDNSSHAGATPANPEAEYLRQLQALEGTPRMPASPATPPMPATAPRGAGPDQDKPPAPSAAVSPKAANPVGPELNKASGRDYVLFEGTLIEAVLMNRLDGSFAGPVNCLVSEPVYSHDRQHVLIPTGSKVLGEAAKVNTFGQRRLAVAFHRLIMPDGYSVSLDQFKGLDQVGATALRDKVNNHYLKIFGASLAVGVLGGIAEVGTGNVFTESALDRARAGFGENSALAGEQILEKFLNIVPTVTIREGTRVKVYLSNDLLLPDYAQHQMDASL